MRQRFLFPVISLVFRVSVDMVTIITGCTCLLGPSLLEAAPAGHCLQMAATARARADRGVESRGVVGIDLSRAVGTLEGQLW